MSEEAPLARRDSDDSDGELAGSKARPMLDYAQFYPTQLPLQRPGEEAKADELTQPPDLCLLPVWPASQLVGLGVWFEGNCRFRHLLAGLDCPVILTFVPQDLDSIVRHSAAFHWCPHYEAVDAPHPTQMLAGWQGYTIDHMQ